MREAAERAAAAGSTRFCMGAAWRQVRDGAEFDRVLDMVRTVAATGMEVCCTLGMLTADQARQLREAGLHAYNHNLDTGENYYPEIVSTRTYRDRLETLGTSVAPGFRSAAAASWAWAKATKTASTCSARSYSYQRRRNPYRSTP